MRSVRLVETETGVAVVINDNGTVIDWQSRSFTDALAAAAEILTPSGLRIAGQPVEGLTPREEDLLRYLQTHPGLRTRQQIYESVWGLPFLRRDGRTVDVHLSRIRAKLGPHAPVLVTERGRGYRYDPTAC